jgi:hypothetical protein
MRGRRPRTPRLHKGLPVLWGVLLLALPGSALAQAPAQGAPSATPYVDREIEGLTPEAVDDGPGPEYDASGWPRFLRLETRLASSPFDDSGSARLGFGGYGLLETPNHGALSFDGQYTPRSGGGTLTLRQRGMPLAGGWLGNHELGVITAPAPAVTRLPSRVYVPSGYLRGLSGEWENSERGLQVQLGSGEPGRLAVLPDTRFEALGGRRNTLGLQWRPGADGSATARTGWTLALQHEAANRVRDIGQGTGAPRYDADATRLALRHEDADLRWQTQWLTAQRQGQGARSAGWFDAEWDRGAWSNGAGAYRLDEGLSWAGQPMASDLEGVYLRSRYTQRRWSADGSLDLLRSVSGRSPGGYFATANARWRLSADNSLGGGMALRQLGEQDWSTYLEWRGVNGWGPTGLRLELEGGERRADVQRLIQDQEWLVSTAWSLSTSLGLAQFGRDPFSGDGNGTQATAAANFNLPLGSRAGVRGSVISEHGPGDQRRDSLNLGANWRIDHRWSLEGSWVWTRGRARQAFTLDPLAPPVTLDNALASRSFFVALRYEMQAGSRDVPLGGRAADGGGRIEGVVFFDENRNGRQEASEPGVPNATVFLDNRYAVRSDSQGRFIFPFVGTGTRALNLRSDSLPLPWTVVGDGNTSTDVPLRGTVRLSLPVQRAE